MTKEQMIAGVEDVILLLDMQIAASAGLNAARELLARQGGINLPGPVDMEQQHVARAALKRTLATLHDAEVIDENQFANRLNAITRLLSHHGRLGPESPFTPFCFEFFLRNQSMPKPTLEIRVKTLNLDEHYQSACQHLAAANFELLMITELQAEALAAIPVEVKLDCGKRDAEVAQEAA
jgi:hypothetical protein